MSSINFPDLNSSTLSRINACSATSEMSDAERIREITLTIKDADRVWRKRLPFLKYQDAIGAMLLAATLFVCLASAGGYAIGWLPIWLVVVNNAICLSLVRELEHDLVHNLYFKTGLGIQNAMMGILWPFLGNLPHPWFRREMHLLHHRTSGQDEDFEERLIGNGMPFGILKLVAMIEPGIAMLFRKKELESIPFFDGRKLARACFPVVHLYYAALLGWIVLRAVAAIQVGWFGSSNLIGGPLLIGLDFLMVVYIVPNMVRQISVQILSSWMHYHEDVPSRLHETQVLNAWYFFPLNLFAANFGSTHAIHHFYANQPFYLRQLVARDAHRALRQYGVRYNDAGSLLRGNRFQSSNGAQNA